MKNYLFSIALFLITLGLLFGVVAPMSKQQVVCLTMQDVNRGEIYVVSGNQTMEYEEKSTNGNYTYLLSGDYTDITEITQLKHGDLLFFDNHQILIWTLPRITDNFVSFRDLSHGYSLVYVVQGLEKVSNDVYKVIGNVVIERTTTQEYLKSLSLEGNK